MSDVNALISKVEQKMEKLLALHRQSSEEIKTLQKTNNELKQTIEKQKQTIKDLEEKNKVLKLSKIISNNENNHDLKLKINELVREIDKCMALLNK